MITFIKKNNNNNNSASTLYASSHMSLTLYMWTAAFHSSASMK